MTSINKRFDILLLLAGLFFSSHSVKAQELVMGLSHDEISITSDFTGSELVVFGTINNLSNLPHESHDDISMRQTDIVVTIEGPKEPGIVRKKDRILGIWVNRHSSELGSIPASYLTMTTPQETPGLLKKALSEHNLGVENTTFGTPKTATSKENSQEFRNAVIRLKTEKGLYQETANIRFLGDNLFMAKFDIPALIPVGTHRVKSHLLVNNKLISETSQEITITKRGFEQIVYTFSRDYGYLYGLVCVFLAIFTGWLSSVIFKRD